MTGREAEELAEPVSEGRRFVPRLLDVVAVFSWFVLYGGTMVPDVNEAHYMTKAKHFWDPSYCAGDPFLESADAHYLFFVTFGLPTTFLPLPMATWIGRVVCWAVLAVGWSAIARTLTRLPLAGGLSAPLLLAGLHWGHLAGEWVVGGSESKCIAYGLCFLSLAAAMRARWLAAIVIGSVALAFHVVVTGWVALAVAIALAIRGWVPERLGGSGPTLRDVLYELNEYRKNRPGRVVSAAALIAAMIFVGLAPAVALTAGTPSRIAGEAAEIYVYKRLPHHLTVGGFSATRWFEHLRWLFAVAVLAMSCRLIVRYARTSPAYRRDAGAGDWRLLIFTCLAGLVFVAGAAVYDAAVSGHSKPAAAKLLRYYWFRWNDVAWAILPCIAVLRACDALLTAGQPVPRQRRQAGLLPARRGLLIACLAVLTVPGGWLCLTRIRQTLERRVPPGFAAAIRDRSLSDERLREIYLNWLDVCTWVKENTPNDSVVLTPRQQQTFNWYAHRAEVVNWKDVPQNAADLVRWYNAVQDVYGEDGLHSEATASLELIVSLRGRHDFDYVLLDRRLHSQPPLLPILYQNPDYAIFEVPAPRQVKPTE